MNRAARVLVLWAGAALICGVACPARAQEDEPGIVRPEPPGLDDFETDANKDGVPDGWYNARDVKIVPEGGAVGSHFVRFESANPGHIARLSRAFGVNGKKYEAIVIGLWIRLDQFGYGERVGEEPGLIVDFLGDKLRQTSRGSLGPWTTKNMGAVPRWTRVAKRLPVPAGTKDAILSVGLIGASGVLDIDGITFDLVPVGGTETANIARNGNFELGDPEPTGWTVDKGARRVSPGFRSDSAFELSKSGSQGLTALARPVDGFVSLDVSVIVRAQNLRGGGGASATFYFVDPLGRVLPDFAQGVRAFMWSGSFDWRRDRAIVPVPAGAEHAVLQFDKLDGLGSVKIDDLSVTAAPEPGISNWVPYHVEDDTERWQPVEPLKEVAAGSALDFSFLRDAPAGKRGHVVVKGGRLTYLGGGRARFFGVQLLKPTAFQEPARADALADRLARLGVNLVRLGDLDAPLGPDRSLFDDTRDDTSALDPVALQRLDHLIAALKKRGIYTALELSGERRFRTEDGVPLPASLPPGGGPASIFDPKLAKLITQGDRELLAHVNKETESRLRQESSLAWVTLSGETTMFNLIDNPDAISGDYQKEYRELASKSTHGTGRRFWQGLESARWKELADTLRKDGLKAPVAGVSHWRREREFSETQAAEGLDLIDDRLYWANPALIAPRFRSMLLSPDGGLIAEASRKRRTDRPYVVGQWADVTQGTWCYPYEAAEEVLAAVIAAHEDWDALVRRGLFLYPEPWGAAAPGTAGGEDIFQIPEVANAAPQIFALWPHVASILLRGRDAPTDAGKIADRPKEKPRGSTSRNARRDPRPRMMGWDYGRGRLAIDTPYTQGLAGWCSDEGVKYEALAFEIENTYATVLASSAGPEPIAKAKRLLVTAVARVTPTGFRWVDEWRKEPADPGIPPLLAEPVVAKITWTHPGTLHAYVLDSSGARVGPAKTATADRGITLVLDGSTPALHYELTAE